MKIVLKYYIRTIVFLFPIFFLPLIVDGFGFGKNLFLMTGGIIGLVLWVLDLIFSKEKIIKTNKLWWLMLFVVFYSLMTFWKLPVGVQIKSLMYPVGLGTVLAMAVWVFLWAQVNDKNEFKIQLNWLTVSSFIMAISSLVIFLIPNGKLPFLWPKDNPIFSIGQDWSLTGSILTEIVLLLFLVFEWTRRMILKLHRSENYIGSAVLTSFFALILCLDIYRMTRFGWMVLDGYTSWVIAVENLKRNPIFGIGLGNFLTAFNNFRPVTYNATRFWSLSFSNSSMAILQIWTELGIGGLTIIFLTIFGWLKKKKKRGFWLIGLALAMLIFLPLNLITLFLVLWLVGNKVENKETKVLLKVGENNFNAMPYILGVLVFGIGIFGGYWLTRFFMADYFLKKSFLTAAKNNGGLTYDLEIKAISMNPKQPDYRRIYSQTNLALAKTLLSKKEVNDEDRQKSATLIQQAVREGKAAIVLEETNPLYWSNLGEIYRQLIGVADGSADWSYQAYSQAVALDPVNPMLKLSLGGLLYSANKFEEADRFFEQAVANKSDYPNAWYNWAYSAKKLNKLNEAVQRLTQAVSLVPADSADFDKATKELSDWKKELENSSKQKNLELPKTEEQVLTAPQSMPTVNPKEKIDLSGQEMQPPAVVSPSPGQ